MIINLKSDSHNIYFSYFDKILYLHLLPFPLLILTVNMKINLHAGLHSEHKGWQILDHKINLKQKLGLVVDADI